MNKITPLLFAGLMIGGLFACQQDGANAPHKVEAKRSSNSDNYAIYPEHSELVILVAPEKGDAPVEVRIKMEGEVFADRLEVAGGKASLKMADMTLNSMGGGASTEGLRSKEMFGASEFSEGKLEIARIAPYTEPGAGSTHLVAFNLTMRKKTRGLQVPVQMIVNDQHAAMISKGLDTLDLSQWGMRPGENGWKSTATYTLRIRGDAPQK